MGFLKKKNGCGSAGGRDGGWAQEGFTKYGLYLEEVEGEMLSCPPGEFLRTRQLPDTEGRVTGAVALARQVALPTVGWNIPGGGAWGGWDLGGERGLGQEVPPAQLPFSCDLPGLEISCDGSRGPGPSSLTNGTILPSGEGPGLIPLLSPACPCHAVVFWAGCHSGCFIRPLQLICYSCLPILDRNNNRLNH